MRKLLSLILAVLMLMSLAPLALANEVTPAATIGMIEIKNADITPMVGLTPADMGFGTMYADGSSSIITNTDGYWFCDTTSRSLDEDDVFVGGNMYSYCWYFELNSGYSVSSSTNVMINGDPLSVDTQYTDLDEGIIWSKSTLCKDFLRIFGARDLVRRAVQILLGLPDIMQKSGSIDNLLLQRRSFFQIHDPCDPGDIQQMLHAMLTEDPILFDIVYLGKQPAISGMRTNFIDPFHFHSNISTMHLCMTV